MTWQSYQPTALLVGVPLLVAFLMPFLGWVTRNRKNVPTVIAAGLAVFQLFFGLVVVLPKVMEKPIFVFMSAFRPPLGIALWVDAFGVALTSLIWVIALAAFVYNLSYLKVHDEMRFVILTILMATGATGVSLTNDLFNMYVFLEIASISAYALVNAYRTPETAEASAKYLILGSLATAFVLFALILIYQATRSLNMWDISFKLSNMTNGGLWLAVVSLFVGFGVEGALWPLNAWLPDAHPAAPASISAMLSGAIIKIGVLAMVRFAYLLFRAVIPGHALFMNFLLGVAALTVIVGEVAAYRQKDAKRMLAFSSTAQIGYITLGVFSGNVAGFIGGVLHIFGHGISKGLAFLLSGEVAEKVPDRDIEKAQGTLSEAATGYGNLVAVLGLSSMPPFITFFSKLFIIVGLLSVGAYWAAAVLAVGSIVEASYYGRYIAVTSGFGLTLGKFNWRTVGYLILVAALIAISFANVYVARLASNLATYTMGSAQSFDVSSWLINSGWFWLSAVGILSVALLAPSALGYVGLIGAVATVLFSNKFATMLGMPAGTPETTVRLGILAVGLLVLGLIATRRSGWASNRHFQIQAVALGFISVLWLATSKNLLATLIAWEVLSWSGLLMITGDGKSETTASYYSWAMASGLAFMFAVAGKYLGQNWWLLALTIGVLIKMGLFGLHGWMIRVYGEGSPTVGALFSGILSLGAILVIYQYGVDTSISSLVYVLAGIQIIYGAVVALGKKDLREILAYSSLSNMGFLIIAVYLTVRNLGSGVAQPVVYYAPFIYALAYSLFEAILFLAVPLEKSSKSVTATISVLVAVLASAAMPLTGGFLAKWGVYINSVYSVSPMLTAVLMIGTLIAIAYSARWFILWVSGTGIYGMGAEDWSLAVGGLGVLFLGFINIGNRWTDGFFWIVLLTLLLVSVSAIPFFRKARQEGEVFTGGAVFRPESAIPSFEDMFYPYGLWVSKAAANAVEVGYRFLTQFFDFAADVTRHMYTGVVNDYAVYIVLFLIAALAAGKGGLI
ncbi:membrane bound hydrogenase subunit MbxH [Coprothermobacteraceae bacterium]|nr:membrane bound hydrogenase subunit MbxH [Coprothermobacteraceae bacterium]